MFAMDNDTMPAVAVHPGFILKEELESRKLSQKKFAEIIAMPYTQLNEVQT